MISGVIRQNENPARTGEKGGALGNPHRHLPGSGVIRQNENPARTGEKGGALGNPLGTFRESPEGSSELL